MLYEFEFLKELCSGRSFYMRGGSSVLECRPTLLKVGNDGSVKLYGSLPGDLNTGIIQEGTETVVLYETASDCANDVTHHHLGKVLLDRTLREVCGVPFIIGGAVPLYRWDGFKPVCVKYNASLESVSDKRITVHLEPTPNPDGKRGVFFYYEKNTGLSVCGDVSVYRTKEECAKANNYSVVTFGDKTDTAGDAENVCEVEPVDEKSATPLSHSVESHFREVLPYLRAFATLLVSHGLKDYTYIGSCALLAAGFPLCREPHDIDIEVLCDKDADALFAKLRACGDKPDKDRPDDNYNGPGRGRRAFFKFGFAGRTFNVWTKNPDKGFGDMRRFTAEGLWFSGVGDVLEAKAAYGRDKDRSDAYVVIRSLADLFGLYVHADGSGAFIGNPDHNGKEEESDGAEG